MSADSYLAVQRNRVQHELTFIVRQPLQLVDSDFARRPIGSHARSEANEH